MQTAVCTNGKTVKPTGLLKDPVGFDMQNVLDSRVHGSNLSGARTIAYKRSLVNFFGTPENRGSAFSAGAA
jgi:hypothetical protein